MSWPTGSIATSNVDAGTDVPATARTDFLDLINKINTIISYGAPLLPSSSLAWANVTGAPTTLSGYGITDIVNQAFTGGFKNLVASATGTSASISVSADELVVSNSGAYKTLSAVSLTISGASTGANGLDSGALSTNTWYSVWVIWNGTTTAGLLSTSTTSPTLPSGYTHKSRIGWIRTDGSGNKYPLAFVQYGKSVRYRVSSGSNVASQPLMASGANGVWSIYTPTWAAVGVSSFVPPTASAIHVGMISGFNSGSQTNSICAPNNAYGGMSSVRPPPLSNIPPSGVSGAFGVFGCLQLESTNIYVVFEISGGGLLACGWEDNF